MNAPRVSPERLAVALHPDERAIAPTWSNARINCADLALDLRDERAENADLRRELQAANERADKLAQHLADLTAQMEEMP